jgi:hypothetical protein
MKEFSRYGDWVFYASALPLVLAAYGAFAGTDLWLAPTQWLEVAILVVLYALYLKQSK